MLFNKNTYRKTNDKKLLHKIGKQWVTVSIAMLALLGGSFAMKSVTTHADTTPPAVKAQNTNAVKSQMNQNLDKAYSAGVQKQSAQATNSIGSSSASSVANRSISASAVKPSNVQSQANDMYHGLMANAMMNQHKQSGATTNGSTGSSAESSSASSASNESANNSESKPNDVTAPSKTGFTTNSSVGDSGSSKVTPSSSNASDNGMTTLKLGTESEQTRGWNYVQHGINNNDYDRKPVNSAGSSSVNNSASGDQTTPISSASAKSSVASGSNSASKVPSNAPINARKSSFNSAYESYMAQMSGTDSKVASMNATDINTNKNTQNAKNVSPKHNLADSDQTGTLNGLTYTYNTNTKALEFTGGTLTGLLWYSDSNGSDASNINKINSDIKSIKFDNVNVSTTSNMTFMFLNIPHMTKLDLGNNFNTANATDMHYMFAYDSNLQSLNLGDHFDTSKVTDMDSMFYNDNALQDLDLGDHFDTSKVTDMNSMFYSDNALQNLDLGDHFDTSKVTNMGDMFGFMNAGPTSITIKSPNTKISDRQGSDSLHKMYQELSTKDPSGKPYTLATPNDFSKGNVGTFTVNENPELASATIQYQNGNQNVGSLITLSKQPLNQNVSVSSLKNVPNGYKLINPNQQITYNGGTYNVAVKKLSKAAPYGVVYLNQNKTEVGQATLSNLGYVGQTVNIEPQLATNVPQGYHLDNTNPINVTLNDGGIINVNTSNGVGATYRGLLGGMLRSTPDDTDNHVITVSGNPINFNGNVTLNFKSNGKTIKTITKPYSVNTYTGDTVNLLNPSSYLDGSNLTDNNNNPITINNTYFTPDSSNNLENVTVQPSDAPQASGNTKTNNSYVLNYNANNVNDNITYDLSGTNVPSNYQGQTGRMNGTSLNGVYDTNIPLSALNADVPTNYHIVSGSNIRYDNGSHTVELAPDSENVNVTYTDQNGKTYVGSINGQYDQKINDITNNYNLPNGYHVNAGQDSSYTFNGNQNQSKPLNITGNTQNGNITVISKKYDGSTYEGETAKTIHESGNTGNSFTINPADKQFTPDGYSSQSSQYNGTFTPTGLSTNTVTFNYKAGAGTAISVTYDNQHGANVGSGTITGNVDDKGSISSQVPVPNGYTVNNSQTSQYHILANSQNPITIQVTGKPVSELNGQGKFTITINKHIGSKVVPSTKTITVKGKVGDTFTVTPSNYTPTGYTSTTSPVQSSITPNGLAKNSATFDYTANTGDPINVTYINQTSNKVGSGSYTGVVDQTGNITSDVKVPSDYILNGGQDTNFTTTLNDQYITLKVTGKPANATINFINQHGNPAGSETVNGKAGDTVSPNSYPKGYEVPNTPTKYTFNKSGQNPDEDNIRLTGKIANDMNGSKANNAPKTATNGYVTVHVIEKSTNGKVLHQFDTPVSENSKRVGDSYTVKPSDVTPSNYDVASGDNNISGVINSDGSVNNGNVTDTYTVHASDIEPISITIRNQNGHYIDVSTGKLTDSANKATSTISNTTLAQLGGVGDSVDITNYINAPKGYHINGNKSAIEDAKGQKLDTIKLIHKKSGLGAMPLMLTMWTPTPKPQPKPKSNSSANKPSSASVNPSSASITPVAPSSEASSASSSVAPSNVSPDIVIPSSTTNSVSSTSTSTTSSSNVAPSVSSASQSNSKASIESSAVSKIKSASSAKPVVHKISKKSVSAKHIESATPKAHVNKINKVNHRAVSEASNMPTKAVQANSTNSVESGHQVATFEVHKANNNAPYVVASESEPTNTSATNAESAPVSNASNDEAVPTNSAVAKGTVASHNINNTNTNNAHKLPQTNEASSHSLLVAIVALLAGLSLMGVDLYRKHNN